MRSREEWYEEMIRWDTTYYGECLEVTKKQLLEYMEWDAEEFINANYHTEAAGLWKLYDRVKNWTGEIEYFAYHVSDLGPVRQFIVI